MSEHEPALPTEDELAILGWLDAIGERDSATRREMLRRAGISRRARAYLLAQAAEIKARSETDHQQQARRQRRPGVG